MTVEDCQRVLYLDNSIEVIDKLMDDYSKNGINLTGSNIFTKIFARKSTHVFPELTEALEKMRDRLEAEKNKLLNS